MARSPRQYDHRHPFCIEMDGRHRWIGDPARGEFIPKEKRRPRRRKPRSHNVEVRAT